MTKCSECEGTVTVSYEDRPYTDAGLPNVMLMGVRVERCASCSEEQIVYQRLEEVHKMIAKLFLKKSARLAGPEIRFLRKTIGWSGVDFAEHLRVTPETVSRWENGRDAISATADLALRLYFVIKAPVESYPVDDFKDIAQTSTPKPSTVRIPVRKPQEAVSVV
jgi:putative zinc finger/helix-turn-helix YgiT family protein